MSFAFCIKCGNRKKNPHVICKTCGFVPEDEIDLVKSVWLSSNRALSIEDIEEGIIPDEEEVSEFAREIAIGKPPNYPDEDIRILTEQYRALQEGFVHSPLWFGFAFLVIPIIAILVYIFGD